MANKRKNYSAEEKVRLLRLHLIEKEPVWEQYPLVRLFVWLLCVALLSWLIQGIIWLCGFEYSVFSSKGRWIVIVLALGSVVFMMGAEQGSVAAYGMLLDKNWSKKFLTGFIIGATVISAYYIVALLFGIISLSSEIFVSRLFQGISHGLTGFVISPVTQVIFCGCLLGMLRRQINDWLEAQE